KEMLQVGSINEVNINGTCHVIDAGLEYGVNRLVYVSTYTMVFSGKEIFNGNKDLPCFPMDDHGIIDPYGPSKSIAEQLVLKSNASPSKVGVTHYFSILKAKEELGYVPVVLSTNFFWLFDDPPEELGHQGLAMVHNGRKEMELFGKLRSLRFSVEDDGAVVRADDGEVV
ncbi:hypothetical protein GIB67_035792, partial [Kingdonia uniflora]